MNCIMSGMEKKFKIWMERCTYMDWAVLYMRLFAGGMMLFHNIGKMQNYNEIIGSYPSLLYIDNAAVFTIIAIAEVALSVLIIIGIGVRMSALALTLGLVMLILWGGFGIRESDFVWLGMYVFLVVSGGGGYSFDEVVTLRGQKNKPKEQ